MGYHVAPWPVGGDESRRDLRSVLLQNPEIIVTNKPEIVLAILEGQKLQLERRWGLTAPLFRL